MLLANGGKSTENVVTSILQARNINLALGGAIVGPGDLDDLQEEFIDACRIIAVDVPNIKFGDQGK